MITVHLKSKNSYQTYTITFNKCGDIVFYDLNKNLHCYQISYVKAINTEL